MAAAASGRPVGWPRGCLQARRPGGRRWENNRKKEQKKDGITASIELDIQNLK